MKRFKRQLPFLKSVLQEANSMKREEMLKHANADQINAMSEVVLNLLKKQDSSQTRIDEQTPTS